MAHQTVVRNVCELKFRKARCRVPLFAAFLLASMAPGSQAGTLLFRKAGDIWSMNTDGSGQVQQTFIGNADLGRLSNGVFVYRNGTQLYRQALSPGAPSIPIPQTDASMISTLTQRAQSWRSFTPLTSASTCTR